MFNAESLQQLKKSELVELLIKKQEECNQLSELSVNSLSKRSDELESLVIVSYTTSTLLSKKVKSVESELLASQQYSRRECIEIDGIDKKNQ